MNYRRGFQRFYAVVACAWIASISFAILSGSWRPWYSPIFNHGWSSTEDVPPVTVVKSEPLPAGTGTIASLSPSTGDKASPFIVSPEEFLRQETAHQHKIRMWSRMTVLALSPPLIGYLVLFFIVPWVYRGFSPKTQI